jgi:hypothetical protein
MTIDNIIPPINKTIFNKDENKEKTPFIMHHIGYQINQNKFVIDCKGLNKNATNGGNIQHITKAQISPETMYHITFIAPEKP